MQRFLRPRQPMASSPEMSDASPSLTLPNSSINDTTRVDDSIESSPLPELTESTPTPSQTSTSTTRKASSLVWKYAVTGQSILLSNTKIWPCQICQDHHKELDLKTSGGTDTIHNHLRRQHGVDLQTATEHYKLQHKQRVHEISDWVEMNSLPNKYRKSTNDSHDLNPGILRELFGRFISENNLSYTTAESPAFRAFLEYVNPMANDLLPRSGV